MKKWIKILLIFVIVLAIVAAIFMFANKYGITEKGIIIKVEESVLKIMEFDESILIVDLEKMEGQDLSKFKEGQEILVYYDGITETMYPGRIWADRIKILKEETDVEIPIDVLRYANSSKENISVNIEEFTKSELKFSITDTNELPYEYDMEYEYYIYEKENSLNISDSKNKCILIDESSEEMVKLVGECDLQDYYEKLETGKYELVLGGMGKKRFTIYIDFSIDENGVVTYETPTTLWLEFWA